MGGISQSQRFSTRSEAPEPTSGSPTQGSCTRKTSPRTSGFEKQQGLCSGEPEHTCWSWRAPWKGRKQTCHSPWGWKCWQQPLGGAPSTKVTQPWQGTLWNPPIAYQCWGLPAHRQASPRPKARQTAVGSLPQPPAGFHPAHEAGFTARLGASPTIGEGRHPHGGTPRTSNSGDQQECCWGPQDVSYMGPSLQDRECNRPTQHSELHKMSRGTCSKETRKTSEKELDEVEIHNLLNRVQGNDHKDTS